MAKPTIIETPCPFCEKDIKVPYYENVDIAKDPSIKKQILSREFFSFKCPHCESVIPTVGPLLYHDTAVPTMIYLIPEGYDQSLDNFNQLLALVRKDNNDTPMTYTSRIVPTVDRLIEKIHIQDAHLDDRCVELLKMAYLKHYAEQLQKNGTIRDILFMPSGEENDAQIIFLLSTEEGSNVASIDFSVELYHHFETTYAEALKNENAENFQNIDGQWAADFLKAQQ